MFTKFSYTQKIISFLVDALYIQLVLMCMHLPLLIWWGLPLSLLTFVGNIIFSPFLTLFLGISSMIFFCELLGIPSLLLTQSLELLTRLWLGIAAYAEPHVLVALPRASLPYMCTLPAVAVFVVSLSSCKKIYKNLVLITAMAALWLISIVTTPHQSPACIPCGKGAITLFKTTEGICAIESSIATGRVDANQWVTYTLLPEMSKFYGSTHMVKLFVPYLTTSSLQRALTLCKRKLVTTIVLPELQKSPRFISEGVQKLTECAQIHNIMIEHVPATSMPSFHVAQ